MTQPSAPQPPEQYRMVYHGQPLPPFYAAEMLRPLIGRTVWVADSGGRTRNGELADVPNVHEDARESAQPATFVNERPLYLRGIIHIAVYEQPR